MPTTDSTVGALFTLLTVDQRAEIQRVFLSASGLDRDQVAFNPWSFPPIPVPSPRRESGKIRLAPGNVADAFLHHPIYWIDPDLTQIMDDDSEESWTLRMFFLLMGFELWTPELKWFDYPSSVLQHSVDAAEIERYHIEGNPPSVYDSVPLLTEEDLKIPLERVQECYRVAGASCAEILRNEVSEYVDRQAVAVATLEALLGPIHDRDHPHADDPDGVWAKLLEPRFRKISKAYVEALDSDGEIDPIIRDMYDLLQQCGEILADSDSAVATLTIPVIRHSETAADTYSQLTSYLGIATDQANRRHQSYDIVGVAEKSLPTRQPDAVARIREHVFNLFRQCWRRSRLALVNYRRLQIHLPPFPSYVAMETNYISTRSRVDAQAVTSDDEDFERIVRQLQGDA